MLLQTHTVQGAQDVAVSWNVQKMPLQLSAYHCFRTASTCDTAHNTNNSGYLLQDLVIAHYHPPPPHHHHTHTSNTSVR